MNWQLLLGYLPSDRTLWPSELAKKRSQYKYFKDDLLMSPVRILIPIPSPIFWITFFIASSKSNVTLFFWNNFSFLFLNVYVVSQSEISRKLEKSSLADNQELKGESRCVLSRSEINQDEHPLSLGKSSLWNQFFQVNTLNFHHHISYSHCWLNCSLIVWLGAWIRKYWKRLVPLFLLMIR